ncbi:hypothetical protein GCM10009557_79480 [Virgisporangium ochraceum]
MMAAQGAMVAVMVAAPLHLHHRGSDLGAVGTVIGVHVSGMFALAPLNGHLADRYGGRRMLLAGLAVVCASGLLVLGPVGPGLAVPLFLLGYGWSLAMVAGSALLVARVPEGDRIRVQGRVDARVWCVTAVATLSSGQLFAVGGYATLAAVSVALVLVAIAFVARGRAGRGVGPRRPSPGRVSGFTPLSGTGTTGGVGGSTGRGRLRILESTTEPDSQGRKDGWMAHEFSTCELTTRGPDTIEVNLEGGPNGIPRRFPATAAQLAYGKIKVPYLAGYEHFERVLSDNARPDLFSWTTRTKIAE